MSLVGLGATAFATAWFYRLDEVITVQGRLQPQQGGVEVKSPIAGQLQKVLVKNGEIVEKGQAVLKYDVKSLRSEEQSLINQLDLEKARLGKQLSSNLQRQATAKRNILLSEKILDRLRPLESGGAISELQLLRQSNQLETEKDQLMQLTNINQLILSESKSKQEEIQGRLRQVQNQLRFEQIVAPISGTVFDLEPDNDNYVVQKAEALMQIVPRGELSAQVNITNQDIGFIKKGAPVKVRINSFPYTEYGEITGKISQIGADALPPTKIVPSYHFPVNIELSRSILKTREGVTIPLQSGMTVTTNLKLRDRRLIELLSDLFSDRSDSLKRLRKP